jgi:hypothetical protein
VANRNSDSNVNRKGGTDGVRGRDKGESARERDRKGSGGGEKRVDGNIKKKLVGFGTTISFDNKKEKKHQKKKDEYKNLSSTKHVLLINTILRDDEIINEVLKEDGEKKERGRWEDGKEKEEEEDEEGEEEGEGEEGMEKGKSFIFDEGKKKEGRISNNNNIGDNSVNMGEKENKREKINKKDEYYYFRGKENNGPNNNNICNRTKKNNYYDVKGITNISLNESVWDDNKEDAWTRKKNKRIERHKEEKERMEQIRILQEEEDRKENIKKSEMEKERARKEKEREEAEQLEKEKLEIKKIEEESIKNKNKDAMKRNFKKYYDLNKKKGNDDQITHTSFTALKSTPSRPLAPTKTVLKKSSIKNKH